MSEAPILELQAGMARARIAPQLGGRVTACRLLDPAGQPHDVLQPYPETHTDLDSWAKGGVYPLVPYSGRIRHATLWHAGRAWPLQAYPGSPHTLHGIAHRRPWALVAHSPASARLVYQHVPDAHWPWAFEAEMAFDLSPSCLQLELSLRNTDTQPAPAGIGLHPYLLHAAQEPVVYEASPAWPFDADYLALPVDVASRQQGVELTPAQFQAGEVTCFHGAWGGTLQLLEASSGRPRIALQATGDLDQLVMHRPAGAPYLCAEPVSHVPDGFNLAHQGQGGTGLRVLAAGERMAGVMRITTAQGPSS